jgi:hypothetical protein
MTDLARRRFFKEYFVKNAIQVIAELHNAYTGAASAMEEPSAATKNDMDYFESFESAYPLISESSYFLDEEVARLEIDTNGMSQLEIVKEIYRRNKNGHDPSDRT